MSETGKSLKAEGFVIAPLLRRHRFTFMDNSPPLDTPPSPLLPRY